jgi:hypothetical protein
MRNEYVDPSEDFLKQQQLVLYILNINASRF